jgi:hypothetical protein
MKKQKEIFIEGYSFLIEYNDRETTLDRINKANCGRLLWVKFTPKTQLTEIQCIELLERLESNLLSEVNNVVNENKDFYNNFIVSNNFNRRTFDLYRQLNKVYVISMLIYLKIKMKNE